MAEPSSAVVQDHGDAPVIAAGDVLSRLEAAGIEERGDEMEDLSDLDGGEADRLPQDEALEGSGDKPLEDDDSPLEEGDEKPKPEPDDALGMKGKGTRDAPLRHKDLPADKFVEVKTASGERVVVNLKDALAGTFMSRDMVDRHVSVAKEAEGRAAAIAARAVEHQKQANLGVQAMLSNPESLVKALVEHKMPVLREVARAYALMVKDPSLREGLLMTIRNERVAAQSREVEQRRQALERQEQESAQQAEMQRRLAPAYRQGLKDAGILRPQDITDELRDGIRMRFNFLMEKNGGMPSFEEMRWCVVKAAEEQKAKGKLQPPPKPRAAPAPPVVEQRTRPSNGKRDWTKVPESIRMSDPDFLFDRAARALARRSS